MSLDVTSFPPLGGPVDLKFIIYMLKEDSQ